MNEHNSQTDRIHYVNRILNQRLINVVSCIWNSNFALALAKLAREPNGILFLIYSPNRREHLGKFVKISNELNICLAGAFLLSLLNPNRSRCPSTNAVFRNFSTKKLNKEKRMFLHVLHIETLEHKSLLMTELKRRISRFMMMNIIECTSEHNALERQRQCRFRRQCIKCAELNLKL